jgi:hypothetical protein
VARIAIGELALYIDNQRRVRRRQQRRHHMAAAFAAPRRADQKLVFRSVEGDDLALELAEHRAAWREQARGFEIVKRGPCALAEWWQMEPSALSDSGDQDAQSDARHQDGVRRSEWARIGAGPGTGPFDQRPGRIDARLAKS